MINMINAIDDHPLPVQHPKNDPVREVYQMPDLEGNSRCSGITGHRSGKFSRE
jgi:hypothetical protein